MKLFGKSQKQYQSFVGNVTGYHLVMGAMNEAAIENRERRIGSKKHLISKATSELNNVSFRTRTESYTKRSSFG